MANTVEHPTTLSILKSVHQNPRRTKTYGEIKIDNHAIADPVEYKILTDEYDPSYSYKLPILRYYRIKGITDEGVIFLISVDTSEPLGGNPKDEGAFEIKMK